MEESLKPNLFDMVKEHLASLRNFGTDPAMHALADLRTDLRALERLLSSPDRSGPNHAQMEKTLEQMEQDCITLQNAAEAASRYRRELAAILEAHRK